MIKYQKVAITLLLHAKSKHTHNQMENKRKGVVIIKLSSTKKFQSTNPLTVLNGPQACIGQIEDCCLSSSSPLWHVKIQIDKQNF